MLFACYNIITNMSSDENEDPETVTALRRVMISYDVSARWRKQCTMVNYFVFGRVVTVQIKGKTKKYRYSGLTSRPDVERWGQSVFIMKEKDADDFAGYLLRLHIPFTRETIWVRG